MTVSILTLKTGDRVITELKEVFDGETEDNRGICLLMEEPFLLSIEGESQQYLNEQRGVEYQIKFSKWNPYSSDTSYKIPYDCVMTISTPEKGLQNAYMDKISEKKKHYDGTAESIEN